MTMRDCKLDESKISFSNIYAKYLDSIDINLAKEAWQNSRPSRMRSDATIEDLLSTDLAVLDLAQVAIELRIPAFIRDSIALIGGINMWSSSTRVDKISDGWDLVSGSEHYLPVYEEYWQQMKAESKRQDDARLMMPLTYMGTVTVTTSYRTWLKFCKTLEELESNSTEFVKLIITRTRTEILNALELATKTEPKLEYFRPLDIYKTGTLDGSIDLQICFSLFSQLIRHRRIMIESELGKMIQSGDILGFNQSKNINISALAPGKAWKDVLITRNCWVAHYKIWSSVRGSLPEIKEKPCDVIGTCPYGLEMKGRVSGLDPNPPCPIYLRMNKLDVDSYKNNIVKMIDLDCRNIEDWKEYI